MNCVKCGASIDPDSRFCAECGAVVEAPAVPENNTAAVTDTIAAKPENKSKIKISLSKEKIIGLAVGVIIMIIGIVRIFSAGTSISSTSFGADFYTYAYRGIVAISEILAAIQVSLGWVIFAIGAAISVNALRK